MDRMIFLNLPITDIARSRAFYGALGFGFDERFCDEVTACVVVSPTIYFMIMERERFEGFCPGPIGNPAKETAALIALSCESRAEVDAMTEAAVAHGGADNGKVQEMGDYMYSRSFRDPDGNVFEPVWMDVEAAMKAWGKS